MTATEIIKLACKGNADAERFCLAWHGLFRVVDDLYDKDHGEVSDEVFMGALVKFTFEMSGNPFYRQHSGQLFSLMTQGFNAWIDANRLAVSNMKAADVLKSVADELVWHCAFIVGGWSHLRQVCAECREFDFEKARAA